MMGYVIEKNVEYRYYSKYNKLVDELEHGDSIVVATKAEMQGIKNAAARHFDVKTRKDENGIRMFFFKIGKGY